MSTSRPCIARSCVPVLWLLLGAVLWPVRASMAQRVAASPPGQPAAAGQGQVQALDTSLLARRRTPAHDPAVSGAKAGAKVADAFATRSWAPPPAPPPPPLVLPAPPPPEPPAPQAPPLPFRYLGKLEQDAQPTIWYLLMGERLVVARSGDEIDSLYRIDGVLAAPGGSAPASPGTRLLRLTYLPLGQQQTLAIGASP